MMLEHDSEMTEHVCETCGKAFLADTDEDHLWAFVDSPVRCPECYAEGRR